MRRAALAALVLAHVRVAAAAPPEGVAILAETEETYCAPELDVLEKRRKLLSRQGFSPSEIGQRNQVQLDALASCRAELRGKQRRATEEQQDLAEIERRAGRNATEVDREQARREVRRERLGSRNPASLTPAEKAELAAGMTEEIAATHQAIDAAHARDPRFMRVVHSAVACYHGERRAELEDLVSSEESLLKLGSGERTKLYSLRSELKRSDEVLARTREAGRALGGLERCSLQEVATVTTCLAIRLEGRREPACDSEEIEQYLRFMK